MPLDGYRHRPPDDEPPGGLEIDEVAWGLLCMAAVAAVRVLLAALRHEGLSADVGRAVAFAILSAAAAIFRIRRSRPDDPT